MQPCGQFTDGYIAVCEYLEKQGLKVNNCSPYQQAFLDISGFMKDGPYSLEASRQYREKIEKCYEEGLLSYKKRKTAFRLSFLLDSYYRGEDFKLKYESGKRYKVHLESLYQAYVDGFEDFIKEQVSPNSVSGFISHSREFFYYLQTSGVSEIAEIDEETIIGFLTEVCESHPASMNNVCCSLRKILKYLSVKGCRVPEDYISFKSAPKRRRINPALDEDELELILNTPDRTTPMGKRDYAVLLLASFTGFRAIDIANLRFENYFPKERIVRLIQHKTGTFVALPIPDEVVKAIDDYVNNARPDFACDYIFLTVTKPYRKLSDKSSVRNILTRQLNESGYEYKPGTGKGFHAFRRTMGKWLLESDSEPEMISQVLGHRDGEVLKRYLPLVPDSMRDCSLDFEAAPLNSEVYL